MVFDFLKSIFTKEVDQGAFVPDEEGIEVDEEDISRRSFLKKLGLFATGVTLSNLPFDLLARNDDVIIVTVNSRDKNRNNLGAIVQHYCDIPTFLRFYGVTEISQAYQKLATFNGLSNPSLVRDGQKMMIPKVILKRKVSKVAKQKKTLSPKVNFKSKGFQSPFGGRKLPILHKCSQESPQNRSKKTGMHYTCPFDLYGAGRGTSRKHKGHDFYCKVGTKLYPILPGVVIKTGLWRRNNGKTVKIKSGDFVYLYLHMSRINVKVGQKVDYNTLLGYSGLTANPYKTNPHLHLHLYYKGKVVNPLKFLTFMNR